MELELGLALPVHNPAMIQGLDLNRDNADGSTSRVDYSPKQVFLKDHDATLSLLLWSGGRLQMDEDRHPNGRKLHVDNNESSDDDCQVIEGWPPVKSSTPPEQVRKSMHVKVKMEGVAIGRKIDLRHYDCYQALTNTLIHMFAKYNKMDKIREGYTLLYQDKEGDWMLVGYVQWELFVESVQRIEILKNDNKMEFRLLSRKSRF